MRYEMRFGGEGGQGVISIGAILADAGLRYDGRYPYVLQRPTYTSRVRGGPTKVDVILSDEEITFTEATAIDFYLSIAQHSYNKFAFDLKEDAMILVDPNLVPNVQDNGHYRIYRMPIMEIAHRELGKEVLANSVALAAVVELTGIVTPEALEKAVVDNVPKAFVDLNRKALEIGFIRAKDLKQG